MIGENNLEAKELMANVDKSVLSLLKMKTDLINEVLQLIYQILYWE